MSPERKTEVNGYRIEEFYWNGGYVVYVNNAIFPGQYEEAVLAYSKIPEAYK